jgi:hypothetical protein
VKYHTVNTITNGVLVNESNIGQRVEWEASLVSLETGEAHSSFKASGVIEQFTTLSVSSGYEWKYVIFIDAVINGRNVVEAGVPVGFFR